MASLADVAPDAEAALKPGSAVHHVLTYLRTMEARDLDTAKAMLAPGFKMVFPGDCHFDTLEDLIAYGKGRQGTALKTFDRFDETEAEDGTVVYAWGTLYGKKLDMTTDYRDIRFVDRFVMRDGKFVSQMVWNDMGEHGFGPGDRPIPPNPPPRGDETAKGAASKLVLKYLRTMEARDLDAAKAMLGPGFFTIFMGGHRFTTPEELVAFQKGRQQNTWKAFKSFDEIDADDGTVVFCFGTLQGELMDGTPYQNIRYVDRFTLRDGKIVDQMVWNDMAEHGFPRTKV
ncbi:MAG: nuclear transport factor 2 family protein [Alphaproteobacteria bacterium]